MAWFKQNESKANKFNTPKRRPIRMDTASLQTEDSGADLEPNKDEEPLLNETALPKSEPVTPAATRDIEPSVSEPREQTTATEKPADDATFLGISIPDNITNPPPVDEKQATLEGSTLADQEDTPVTAFARNSADVEPDTPDTQDIPVLSAAASSTTEHTDQTIPMFSTVLQGRENTATGLDFDITERETVVPLETGANNAYQEAETDGQDTAEQALELNPPVRVRSVVMLFGLAALVMGLVWALNNTKQVDDGGSELDTVQTIDAQEPDLLELTDEDFSTLGDDEPKLIIDDEFVGEIPDLAFSDGNQEVLPDPDGDSNNEQAIYDSFDANLEEPEPLVSATEGAVSIGTDGIDSDFSDAGEFAAVQDEPIQGQASANTPQPNGELPRTVIVRDGDMLSTIAQRAYNSSYLWPLIYEANRNLLSNPHDIEVGMALVLPPLQEQSPGNITR